MNTCFNPLYMRVDELIVIMATIIVTVLITFLCQILPIHVDDQEVHSLWQRNKNSRIAQTCSPLLSSRFKQVRKHS